PCGRRGAGRPILNTRPPAVTVGSIGVRGGRVLQEAAMRRREFLGTVGAGLVAARTTLMGAGAAPQTAQTPPVVPRKGRIKQGVTRGVFARGAALDDCCREAARLGIKGFDLIGPADWPTLKKYGLVPSMYQGTAGNIPNALNRKENHDKLEATLRAGI